MIDKMFLTSEQANARLDKHVNIKIDDYLRKQVLDNYKYTNSDLSNYVNDSETLLDYIRDSEEQFGLKKRNLTEMSDTELNYYIMKLDLMWSFYVGGM